MGPQPRGTARTIGCTRPVVAALEELGVLLARGDAILLSRPLDPDYRDYLARQGLALPTMLVPENCRPERSTTANALDSPVLLDRLRQLGAAGAHLLPMGTTSDEEELARRSGLTLATPAAAVVERVNSKIYGRRLAEAAGLRPVPGVCCETRQELAEVLTHHRLRLESGEPLVVKDAYGVSGKGLLVLENPGRARSCCAWWTVGPRAPATTGSTWWSRNGCPSGATSTTRSPSPATGGPNSTSSSSADRAGCAPGPSHAGRAE